VTDSVAVYSGKYTECLFLGSLLRGSGIEASVIQERELYRPENARVAVDRANVEAAMSLVEHFNEHGKKSPGFWDGGQ
jgi:hypothetical protein